MKFLRDILDKQHPKFAKGGKLEKFYALYEMADTFLYTPGTVTKEASHVRDGMDLKRMMITVVVALTPCILIAIFNTGYQANLAMDQMGVPEASGWRETVIALLGSGYDPSSIWANFIHGLLYFLPIFLVCNLVGGFWEGLFASVRGHEINEGFLVTGMLFPLILPATIPLWQVALGISFGVVFGKEIFGGTGKNFLNPALTGRAFLFFAYPAQISGDQVWVAVDGFSGATPLGAAINGGLPAIEKLYSFSDALIGFIPGSIGETSALACLFGAIVLIVSGVGSWRIMLSVLIGAMGLSALLYFVGSSTNPMFSISPLWHLVIGGFAFGLVFMATDPVSSAMSETGQWIYGILIGMMVILIRVVNPAYPEGMMLAILFGNICAPVIDYYVVKANIKRRKIRNAQ
ncbi:MAG: NADH:ubiquinone reductase (Na(+)-transporting) subunit B [Deltaproteobacteria bacterium]|nr:NADH:ubiquinone reductase (Na(+)-transporting) subunit B [Deltaproteobacteria bacterium]